MSIGQRNLPIILPKGSSSVIVSFSITGDGARPLLLSFGSGAPSPLCHRAKRQWPRVLLPRGDGALPLLLPSAATLSPPLLLSKAAVAARPPPSRKEGAEALLIPSAAALPPDTIVEQSSSGLAACSDAEIERGH